MAAVSSDDGFLRLALNELWRLPMRHLLSGLEHEPHARLRCGTPTTICGYSEWVSAEAPQLSLGWDWYLSTLPGLTQLLRVGPPHSNVMLVDQNDIDYDQARNLTALGAFVDALPWRVDTVLALSLCTL